jgi:hypothetical protein
MKMSPLRQLQMTLAGGFPQGVGVTVRLMSDGELSRRKVLRVLDELYVSSDTRFPNNNCAQEILLQRSLKPGSAAALSSSGCRRSNGGVRLAAITFGIVM